MGSDKKKGLVKKKDDNKNEGKDIPIKYSSSCEMKKRTRGPPGRNKPSKEFVRNISNRLSLLSEESVNINKNEEECVKEVFRQSSCSGGIESKESMTSTNKTTIDRSKPPTIPEKKLFSRSKKMSTQSSIENETKLKSFEKCSTIDNISNNSSLKSKENLSRKVSYCSSPSKRSLPSKKLSISSSKAASVAIKTTIGSKNVENHVKLDKINSIDLNDDISQSFNPNKDSKIEDSKPDSNKNEPITNDDKTMTNVKKEAQINTGIESNKSEPIDDDNISNQSESKNLKDNSQCLPPQSLQNKDPEHKEIEQDMKNEENKFEKKKSFDKILSKKCSIDSKNSNSKKNTTTSSIDNDTEMDKEPQKLYNASTIDEQSKIDDSNETSDDRKKESIKPSSSISKKDSVTNTVDECDKSGQVSSKDNEGNIRKASKTKTDKVVDEKKRKQEKKEEEKLQKLKQKEEEKKRKMAIKEEEKRKKQAKKEEEKMRKIEQKEKKKRKLTNNNNDTLENQNSNHQKMETSQHNQQQETNTSDVNNNKQSADNEETNKKIAVLDRSQSNSANDKNKNLKRTSTQVDDTLKYSPKNKTKMDAIKKSHTVDTT